MNLIIWMISGFFLVFFCKEYPLPQYPSFYVVAWVIWICFPFMDLNKKKTLTRQNIKRAIQCFMGKYWCEKKGYWFDCAENPDPQLCEKCSLSDRDLPFSVVWIIHLFYIVTILGVFSLVSVVVLRGWWP